MRPPRALGDCAFLTSPFRWRPCRREPWRTVRGSPCDGSHHPQMEWRAAAGTGPPQSSIARSSARRFRTHSRRVHCLSHGVAQS
eukprot:1643395-Prymnesium_polylepis.1